MFTGIVTALGTLREVQPIGDGHDMRLVIGVAPEFLVGAVLGCSIACSGVCLTVTSKSGNRFTVDVSGETVSRTASAMWSEGARMNLERSLKLGDELGGHLVTGHVDGVAEIVKHEPIAPDPADPWGATARFHIRAPKPLAGFIAAKGSVCLDGTSLTVNSVDGDIFTVLLIPHSLSVTTWRERKAGDGLHIEVDLMARYAARLAEARAQGY
jgi:riboflavin synthase